MPGVGRTLRSIATALSGMNRALLIEELRPIPAALRAPHDEADPLTYGPSTVLVLRDFGGKRFGSALLGRVLHWLRDHGLANAQATTPSSLNDYDPTVYLHSLSDGARIVAEYVVLVKGFFAEPGAPPTSSR